MEKFRVLKANEIECRVGTVSEKGFSLLLYKDARVDMNILDETIKPENWTRDHKELKNTIYCGISIKVGNEWVTKWDCGSESNTEKEKGESSDSFKRAAFNWGIGRELYTAPKIFIKDNVKQVKEKWLPKFWEIDVAEIGYNEDREINHLVITGDGEEIYTFNKNDNKPFEEVKKQIDTLNSITLEYALQKTTSKGKHYYELDDNQLQFILESDKSSSEAKQCARLIRDDRKANLEQVEFVEIKDGDLPF